MEMFGAGREREEDNTMLLDGGRQEGAFFGGF